MGIVYGLVNQSRLSASEKKIRIVEAERKIERDAQLAIERAAAADREFGLDGSIIIV